MKSKAKAATKAERQRMARLKEMPCVACVQMGMNVHHGMPTEVHHLLSGNRRRGHQFTIPLCTWHHRGYKPSGPNSLVTIDLLCREAYGPSLADGSKRFHAAFGTDDELLALTNQLLEKHREPL